MSKFNSPIYYIKPLFSLRHWQRRGGLIWYAILLGFIGGGVAALFSSALHFTQKILLVNFAGFPFDAHTIGVIPPYLFFLVPAIGGLIAGIIVYKFSPDAAGAGTDALIDAYHNKKGFIALRTSIVKFFASVITLGSGGSAGQEGPMAQIGGGIGSFVGRILKLPDRYKRILLLTGTAAGLGAIFHAPLGAALTSAEIVYKEDFESQGFLPFTIASVVAFAFFSVITDQHTAYLTFPQMPFEHYSELFLYALVGLACVPFSWAFIRFFFLVKNRFDALKIPNYFKPALGGLVVGGIAYISPEAIGADWTALQLAVAGEYTFKALLVIAVFKILATSFTIGSGGSGGVFGPSLFIGGMVGGAVGFGLEATGLGLVSNPSSYVLVGMGAYFAGAAKAPLAGLIMVCEITGNYGLLAPLLIASSVHITLSKRWSLYVNQRQNKFSSPVHEAEIKVDHLKGLPVKKLVDFSPIFAFQLEESIWTQWKKAHATDQEIYPVVDNKGQLCGLVSANDLHVSLADSKQSDLFSWTDIMLSPAVISVSDDLQQALKIFLQSDLTQLPVISVDGKLIGLLRLHDVMDAYQSYLKPKH